MSTQIPGLYIAASQGRGRGVFTALTIPAGSLIEVCPAIICPAQDLPLIHRTVLHDYYFLWENQQCAIALGFGSLYNHASQPNADYRMDYEQQTIDFFSLRQIEKGEEITVHYTNGGAEKTTLWFAEQ